jgi:hypothetical protein
VSAVLTAEELRRRIPKTRYSGDPRSARLAEIDDQLRMFRFEPHELRLFDREIQHEVAQLARVGRKVR